MSDTCPVLKLLSDKQLLRWVVLLFCCGAFNCHGVLLDLINLLDYFP